MSEQPKFNQEHVGYYAGQGNKGYSRIFSDTDGICYMVADDEQHDKKFLGERVKFLAQEGFIAKNIRFENADMELVWASRVPPLLVLHLVRAYIANSTSDKLDKALLKQVYNRLPLVEEINDAIETLYNEDK